MRRRLLTALPLVLLVTIWTASLFGWCVTYTRHGGCAVGRGRVAWSADWDAHPALGPVEVDVDRLSGPGHDSWAPIRSEPAPGTTGVHAIALWVPVVPALGLAWWGRRQPPVAAAFEIAPTREGPA